MAHLAPHIADLGLVYDNYTKFLHSNTKITEEFIETSKKYWRSYWLFQSKVINDHDKYNLTNLRDIMDNLSIPLKHLD